MKHSLSCESLALRAGGSPVLCVNKAARASVRKGVGLFTIVAVWIDEVAEAEAGAWCE